ncbi:6-phosphogluconolactonase [Haliangium sp.]|uniref:6-phosphogluconolactonase n=1 Tax=Haliangium sp. TaxID=2663208 RepID=UPI003D0D6FA9
MTPDSTTDTARPHEYRFDDRALLADTLAEDIAGSLRAAVDDRGAASLVLSGGRTPVPLFEALAARALPWDRITVTLADERWVDPTAEDSNERLVRHHLLRGPAAAARFVGLKTPAETPEAGAAETARALAAVPRPFDVLVLGMGDDGHTASLFPHTAELAAALAPESQAVCAAVRPAGLQPRMTLTLATLLASRRIVLHLSGDGKWAVYQRALAGADAGEMPIRAVLAHRAPVVEVYWAP